MEVKDALQLMFQFGMFVLALLTRDHHQEKVKTHPKVDMPKVGFCPFD